MKVAIPKKISIVYQELNRTIYLKRLLRNRFLPREKLRQIQFKKFKKVLIHAYNNVPFYREKYSKYGYDPYKFKTEDDILKIPLLTKQEIRENFPNNIISRRIDLNKCMVSRTSGSTTKPLEYIVSPENQFARDAIHEFVHNFVGCSRKDTLIHLITLNEDNITKFERNKNIIRFFSSYTDVNRHIQIFNEINPEFLKAAPSYFISLGIELMKVNFKFKKQLKGIITTGENLSNNWRNKIEQLYNSKVFDSYGCSETVDVACECHMHEGMHEIMLHAYIEMLNGNKPVSDMESGRIIITDLDNYSMPFIRYDVQDYAVRSFENCSCGITSPKLIKLLGRMQDFLVSENDEIIPPFALRGNKAPFHTEPLVSLVDFYQIYQHEDKSVTILLVTDQEIKTEIKENLKDFTKLNLGNVPVTIKTVKDVPREKHGKFRFVISEAVKDVLVKLEPSI